MALVGGHVHPSGEFGRRRDFLRRFLALALLALAFLALAFLALAFLALALLTLAFLAFAFLALLWALGWACTALLWMAPEPISASAQIASSCSSRARTALRATQALRH